MDITPLMLAQASKEIYSAPASAYHNYWETDSVVIGHECVGDTSFLTLRGSLTTEDWLRDAEAIPEWHSQLGFVHSGFLQGMDEVFANVRKVVQPNVVITGHSLGGARARILAALFAVNNQHIAGTSLEVCTFGSPKPGFINLARIIQKSGMKHTSYRNRNDIVPTLPFILPWEHTEPWIALDAAPEDSDLEPLRDHSCDLYIKASASLPTT